MKPMLTQYYLTMVGTFRRDAKRIPSQFIAKNREICSSLFGFNKDMTIVSYIPKKNKCVILSATMHHDDKLDDTTKERRKPETITFYNKTKGGVDTSDKMCA